MSLEEYPGLNENRKRKILAMSDDELRVEIELGASSTMPKCIPYMKAVLESRRQGREDRVRQEDLTHAQEMLRVARGANRIALWAIGISVVALIVSVIRGH